MAKILITGGLGFIGYNFLLSAIKLGKHKDVCVIDKFTYAANTKNIDLLKKTCGIQIIKCDVTQLTSLDPEIEYIVHFAAESHVDRSIGDPHVFFKTNVEGTYNLLHLSKDHPNLKRFMYISTDEVYGSLSLDDRPSKETDPIYPRSPYSASKAAGESFCFAYYATYNVPVIVSRCCNNYGPHQHNEKLIPTIIRCLKDGIDIPIYGTGANIREWIHVEDHVQAIWELMYKGTPGEIYNIGSGEHYTNISVAYKIMNIYNEHFRKSPSKIKFVADRQGHDFRYSLNSDKLRALGWEPQYKFEESLYGLVESYI